MAVLQVVKMGHPILRKKAKKVKNVESVVKLVRDMQETLEYIGASGLAAPQVLVEKRVVVYRVRKDRIPQNADFTSIPWTVMINPKISPISKKKKMFWERCLSIPGLHGKVPRYDKIKIEYLTLDNKKEVKVAKSTWAALLQHECDHLDGILYPMRMSDLSKLSFNDVPGEVASEASKSKKNIDPLFLKLVEDWQSK
tara:strand:- start:2142 stop:2732 length:591 start_codon:yes stop_codon:yes gene_type:complete